MATTVLIVLVLILISGYAAFFAVANPQMIEVITFRDLHNLYVEHIPIWVLPVAGMLVGAILMAIALSGPWGTMRRAATLARQQFAAEREKSSARAKKINALTKQLNKSDESRDEVEEDKSAEDAD